MRDEYTENWHPARGDLANGDYLAVTSFRRTRNRFSLCRLQRAKMNSQIVPSGGVDLRVLLVYENLASALRAADILALFSRKQPPGVRVKMLPWSFSVLQDAHLRTEAASSAQGAHLIFISAFSETARLPAVIESWLQACLTGPHGGDIAVAAFFHRESGPNSPDSPRLRSVRRIALKTGCAFFTPGPTSLA